MRRQEGSLVLLLNGVAGWGISAPAGNLEKLEEGSITWVEA